MKTNPIFRILNPSIFNLKNVLVLCLLLVASSMAFGQTYCTPTGVSCNTAPSGEPFYISDLYMSPGQEQYGVPVVTLTNSNCPINGYKDETSSPSVMPLQPGTTLTVVAGINYSYNSNTMTNTSGALWIDYNKDGSFNNSNELIGIYTMGSTPSSSPYFIFSLPAGGYTFGNVRARFRVMRDANISVNSSCGTLPNPSDCRDFLLNITPYCFQGSTPRFCRFGYETGCSYVSNYFTGVSFTSSAGTTTKTSTYGQIGYSDYRSTPIPAPYGNTFTISGNIFRENPGAFYNYNWLTIYADWDNNGSYADAGELVGFNNLPNNSSGNIPFSYSITIPSWVTSQKVNIRLMTNYDGIVNACTFAGTGPFIGETEDYSILIAPAGILAGGVVNMCSPANPGLISFSTAPSPISSVYLNWYYQDGLIAQPLGTTPPKAPWKPITNNNPVTGLPTMTSFNPPAGLNVNRTYACFVTSRIIGQPPKGWALGVVKVKVKNCTGRMAVGGDIEADVENESSETLSQNFPNPFNSETTIPCFIPEETKSASLEIFGMDGRKLQQIPVLGTGKQDISISRKMLTNSGMYLYTMVIDGQKQAMKRMVIVE